MLRANSYNAQELQRNVEGVNERCAARMPASPSKQKMNHAKASWIGQNSITRFFEIQASKGGSSSTRQGCEGVRACVSAFMRAIVPILCFVYLVVTIKRGEGGEGEAVFGRSSRSKNVMCAGVPRFVVFVDAGSTGCRAHAFRVNAIEEDTGNGRLFSLTTIGKKVKSKRPLASMFGKTRKEIESELLPMLREAMEKVELEEREMRRNTNNKKSGNDRRNDKVPLYVWATAGMRVLSENEQREVWSAVSELVRDELPRFAIGDEAEHFKTIDGEDEGFYAWLAANYLVGVDVTSIGSENNNDNNNLLVEKASQFDEIRKPLDKAIGAIDVGGGSAQVVTMSGRTNPRSIKTMQQLRKAVRVKSYLGYGANHMEKRWRNELANRGETSDPCGFVGYEAIPEMKSDHALIGSGEYEKCALGLKKQIKTMLLSDGNEDMRLPKTIFEHEDNKFLGMSLLYHLTHFISVVMPSSLPSFPKPTLLEIGTAAKALCSTNWNVVKSDYDGKDPNTPSDRLNGRCFDAALVDALLSIDENSENVGFGFPKYSESRAGLRMIEFAEDVNGSEVEWTLGAAISEIHPAAIAQASGPGGDAAEFEKTCTINSRSLFESFKNIVAIMFVLFGIVSLYSARALVSISSNSDSSNSRTQRTSADV